MYKQATLEKEKRRDVRFAAAEKSKLCIPVLIGDFHLAFTLAKKLWPGIPPSRAKAYIMRELEVIENVL